MKSLQGTWAIGWNTFTELVRMKVFYFLLIFALLIIGNSAFVAKFSFQEQFQMLKDISLGAMSVFSSLLAILATANFLPKDIEDRTIYTILAKPVPRFSYLLGKLVGILLLLALSILLMTGLSRAGSPRGDAGAARRGIRRGSRPRPEGSDGLDIQREPLPGDRHHFREIRTAGVADPVSLDLRQLGALCDPDGDCNLFYRPPAGDGP